MALTPPPPAPNRGDRLTFSARVDAFLMWLVALVAELNVFLLSLTRLAAGGANSFAYAFDATTTDADPGPGRLRLGPGAQNAATVIRIDLLSGDNADVSAVLTAMLSGTSTNKASLRIQKVKDPKSFLLFDVTGSTAAAGYRNLTVVPRASSGTTPFANNDDVIVYIERVGDKGDTGVPPVIPYMKVSDRKTQNTAPQQLQAGTVVRRNLNTIDFNGITGTGLSGDLVSLPVGIYDIRARAPASATSLHRAQVYNQAGLAVLLQGANANTSTGQVTTDSTVTGRLNVATAIQIGLGHYCNNSAPGGGIVNSGQEVYSELEIWKVG